ncbi:MAG: hypothetical protein KF736_12500 [Acidobacteria bacterium]|nr:hypothetical protein [Acidobacteriota bacterium]MCW5950471.1 hypothetical protein [Pyrinomonadaceae bacterium]
MKKFLLSTILTVFAATALIFTAPGSASAAAQQDVVSGTKMVYRKTKGGTKVVVRKTRRGGKVVFHKVKRGGKWTYHKVKRGGKWTYHKTKRGIVGKPKRRL